MGTMGSVTSILFTILIIALIILFFVSLFSYVTRKVINSSTSNQHIVQMNQKLDKIIDLLEEKENEKN